MPTLQGYLKLPNGNDILSGTIQIKANTSLGQVPASSTIEISILNGHYSTGISPGSYQVRYTLDGIIYVYLGVIHVANDLEQADIITLLNVGDIELNEVLTTLQSYVGGYTIDGGTF
jgi:hypothetical protein